MADEAEGLRVRIWVQGTFDGSRMYYAAVIEEPSGLREMSDSFPGGTSNQAELQAINLALLSVRSRGIPVEVISDSRYAVKVCSGAHRAKANLEILEEIREMSRAFPSVRFIWRSLRYGGSCLRRAGELAAAERSKNVKPDSLKNAGTGGPLATTIPGFPCDSDDLAPPGE